MHHTAVLISAFAAALVQGHMAMQYPPQFRAQWNPTADPNTIDYTPTAPLSGAAAFPCKGYHVGMTEKDSTATWAAGSTNNMTVKGSAVHGGGSCQVSLSYDSGKTFQVIHSYIGSCPLSDGEAFDFKVPADAPSGLAIFSWSWVNRIGAREFYQSCSAVTIQSGTAPAKLKTRASFAERPAMFVANLGSGCITQESKDVVYPDPGPAEDVTIKGDSSDPGFSGDCGGSGNGNGTPGNTTQTSIPTSAQPTSVGVSPTSLAIVPILPTDSASSSQPVVPSASTTFATSTSALAPAPTNTNGTTGNTGDLPISTDGSCGPSVNLRCSPGNCCSSAGFCGSSNAYSLNSQAGFGDCNSAVVAREMFPSGIAGRLKVTSTKRWSVLAFLGVRGS